MRPPIPEQTLVPITPRPTHGVLSSSGRIATPQTRNALPAAPNILHAGPPPAVRGIEAERRAHVGSPAVSSAFGSPRDGAQDMYDAQNGVPKRHRNQLVPQSNAIRRLLGLPAKMPNINVAQQANDNLEEIRRIRESHKVTLDDYKLKLDAAYNENFALQVKASDLKSELSAYKARIAALLNDRAVQDRHIQAITDKMTALNARTR